MASDAAPLVSYLVDTPPGDLPILSTAGTQSLYHATPETGTYSHHSHIMFHGGVLYATWSNHAADEDAPGQRVLMRRSTDPLGSWGDCVELFPPLDRVDRAEHDGAGRRTQCANGFAVLDDVLYAFSEVWDDGGGCREGGQGRLVRRVGPGDTPGNIFWLRTDAPASKVGLPAFPPGEPALVDWLTAHLRRPGNELTWDFRNLTTRPTADDGHLLCEPTPAWRLADGAWCKLYRDLGASFHNYASFSRDDGATWIPPTRTTFPDANSRATAGTLPDGQVYVVSNTSPSGRDPLVISLSRDGLTFDRAFILRVEAPPRRHEGRWKGHGFQYPNTAVVGEHLWVMYSVNKEDVQLTCIPLAELASP